MEYEIKNACVTVKISSKGAQLQSIIKDGAEYLWQGDEKFWPDRAPVLFPYVGRFTEGKYRFCGREYHMDIHGFARHLEYKVSSHDEDSITFFAGDSEETFEKYPFRFRLCITYMLKGNRIDIRCMVENKSQETMYFGIGGHPGFNVPLESGLEFSDYYLEFSDVCRPDRVLHSEDCFLSGNSREWKLEDGKRYCLHHDMFDEDAIVLKNMADKVTLKSDKGKRSITVSYPQMPFLGLWHAPKTSAPYLCIEPWTSLPSRKGIVEDIRYKSDLIRLPKDGKYENVWSIEVGDVSSFGA